MRLMKNIKRISPGCQGWTILDAVIVFGLISILAMVVISWIASASQIAATMQATNNLHQLTKAWTEASQDNEDFIPSATPSGGHPIGEWSGGGWLDLPVNERIEVDPYYNGPSARGQSLSKSTLWDYVGHNPLVYRDPRDRSTGSWPTYMDGADVPRVRSFAMNAFMASHPWNKNLVNPDTGKPYTVFRKLSDITSADRPGPDFTFVLISEHPGSINDGQFYVDMTAFQDVTKLRLRLIDIPSAYHGGRGTLSFADNHVELRKWLDIRTMPQVTKFELQLNIPTPDNPDVGWLQNRTSW